jgi:hypothetical protein
VCSSDLIRQKSR